MTAPLAILRAINATPNEKYSQVAERVYRPNGVRRPVIYFTGSNGNDRDFLDTSASASQLAPALASVGYPVYSAQFGSPPYAWGNDTCQTRIGQAFTNVQVTLGTATDKIILIGVSKGATASLNYARNNPTKVAAIIGVVPAVNVSDIYDNNRSGLAAEIDNAYGGNWSGNKATHDPALNTATHASQAIPTRFYYGTNDTTVIPSVVTAFAAAVPSVSLVSSATDHLTTGPGIDPDSVLAFLEPYA